MLNVLIRMPDEDERSRIARNFSFKGFPNCIGSIDGTHIPFYEKPLDCPEDYYSRKHKYGMQLQVLVDENKRIRHIYTGMPASVHDATVFRRSNLTLPEENYVLGDSAYSNSNSIVTPFRRRICTRPVKEGVFNRQLSSLRVSVEHAIGILKNRFQSLRGLRIRVDKKNGHRRACEWISACCVLYNIIYECDPWSDMDVDEFDPDVPNLGTEREEGGRRLKLMENIWQMRHAGLI
jgi:hypothetical protein